eukprot:CAMPEP_0174380190 /NCGR_PEP_ID=MMETSP0811_2-20130205/123176_1 /TAXON_ID=73025 ORGANISM="Eutreptiella gymnastica-like, Strain CCMP1594" /NCGR_SAMPLE_ID=MMETSP0811_2 /ASSEMBLY_ACC=CAM_ASM_000667 /LENGTH=259 /DNA_ID=CAMNT_0015532969 /DNA_START=1562 /DNA_END=2338 /DNA_ORIENTATION=-
MPMPRRACPPGLFPGGPRDVAAPQLLLRDPGVLGRRSALHQPLQRPELLEVGVGHLPHVLPFAAAEERLQLVGLGVVPVVHRPLDLVVRHVLGRGPAGRQLGLGLHGPARVVVDGDGLVPGVPGQVVRAGGQQVGLVEAVADVGVPADLRRVGGVRGHVPEVPRQALVRDGLGGAPVQIVGRARVREVLFDRRHAVAGVAPAGPEVPPVARGRDPPARQFDEGARAEAVRLRHLTVVRRLRRVPREEGGGALLRRGGRG